MKIELEKFAPGNDALQYLEKRVADPNYRGDVSSQHNRWTFDDLIFILGKMNKYIGNQGFLKMRTTDKSKRAQNTLDEFDYAKFCEEVIKGKGKGSQDAMRKNYFPDWHRCGWINRYDKNRNVMAPYEKGPKSYVKISEEGLKLLSDELTRVDKYFIFSKGLDKMYRGIIGILIDLFRNHEIKFVDLHEFTFFVTGISSKGTYNVAPNEVAELIKSWRLLTSLQRKEIDNYLGKTLLPGDAAINKTYQRDFHNWINKTQQTFSLLKQTIYFEEVDHINFSHFNRIYYLGSEIEVDEGFDKTKKLKINRSLQQKYDYFAEHSVKKKKGFELHHIVALAWAESQGHFKMLDDWRNMIYIDGFSHARITQNNNLNMELKSVPPTDLELIDYDSNSVFIEFQKNGLYDVNKIPTMLDYNNELRKK